MIYTGALCSQEAGGYNPVDSIGKPWIRFIELESWQTANISELCGENDWTDTHLAVFRVEDGEAPTDTVLHDLVTFSGRPIRRFTDETGRAEKVTQTRVNYGLSDVLGLRKFQEAMHPEHFWHNDNLSVKQVAGYTAVTCDLIPNAGGETEFFSTPGLVNHLSDRQRSVLEATSVTYITGSWFLREFGSTLSADELGESVTRPLVAVDPVSLHEVIMFAQPHFVSASIKNRDISHEVDGMGQVPVVSSNRFYRHKWREGDVIQWVNLAAQHRARKASGFRRVRKAQSLLSEAEIATIEL